MAETKVKQEVSTDPLIFLSWKWMTRMVSWGLHLEQPFPEEVGSAVDTALPCDVWSICLELENGSCNWEPGC